jgi:hypothetical protein
MTDLLQIIGALLVLAGFGATQFGRLSTSSVTYLTVNLVGSGLLAGLALAGQEWGFLLLEGVWAIVSAVGLARVHAARVRAVQR